MQMSLSGPLITSPFRRFELPHDKTNKMTVCPAKTQISLGILPVWSKSSLSAWVLIYPLSAQRRLWSDWADAQADLSLHWAHSHFGRFVMWRLIFSSLQGRSMLIIASNPMKKELAPTPFYMQSRGSHLLKARICKALYTVLFDQTCLSEYFNRVF